jgi:hypothetical protein
VPESLLPGNGRELKWRVDQHDKRLDHLERFEPAVMTQQLKELDRDVTSLKRAFYTFAFGIVGSAIVFAFSVFALLGGH